MSHTDPRKLKAMIQDSQAVIPEPEEDGEDKDGAADADEYDDEGEDEGGDGEEMTVESLAKAFKPAVATIN